METDTRSGRPRPWLVVALVLTAALAAAYQFWPTKPAPAAVAPSNARRATPGAQTGTMDPSDLNVRLDDLRQPRPAAKSAARNPFRFQPKPSPPPPAPPVTARPAPQPEFDGPPQPPPPPPIPLKFIGTVEPKPGDRVAAFSDCLYTFRGRAGDIIDGRYRLVSIGVESVVMEYLDGRGRTTIRMSAPECVRK